MSGRGVVRCCAKNGGVDSLIHLLMSSGLLHHRRRSSELSLNLFPGPASRLERTRLELSVRLGFLNHSS